jgi:hypothetical protein
MVSWTAGLDRTAVAVLGPPGTGKTYRGARQIYALVKAGKRVGITATSHYAIDDLLKAVVELFANREDSADLWAVKRGSTPAGFPGDTHAGDNTKATKPDFNLVAGTTWLFTNALLVKNPVDVLVIDEAGQLSLADALAAAVRRRICCCWVTRSTYRRSRRRRTQEGLDTVCGSTCWATT